MLYQYSLYKLYWSFKSSTIIIKHNSLCSIYKLTILMFSNSIKKMWWKFTLPTSVIKSVWRHNHSCCSFIFSKTLPSRNKYIKRFSQQPLARLPAKPFAKGNYPSSVWQVPSVCQRYVTTISLSVIYVTSPEASLRHRTGSTYVFVYFLRRNYSRSPLRFHIRI